MTPQQQVLTFAKKYQLDLDQNPLDRLVDDLLSDMKIGLTQANPKSLKMLPTYMAPPQTIPQNQKIIVIDAGGTNFRSCLVEFDEEGEPQISHFHHMLMPGVDREYGKQEFFATIAKSVAHLKNQARQIGFCFSYAMEMTPEHDGKVLNFAKEIKASEVIGSLVGHELKQALIAQGWNSDIVITVVNDTTSALLAGASRAIDGTKYSSQLGFILGTGINTAYLETRSKQKPSRQIIVCEAGAFDKVKMSQFDDQFDATTQAPGTYLIEKMAGGGYVGAVASRALRQACQDRLFDSDEVNSRLSELSELSLPEINQFLQKPWNDQNRLSLALAGACQADRDKLWLLCDLFVERSARLASGVVTAGVIKTGQGQSPTAPVGVLCEGTTLYATTGLYQRFASYLDQELVQKRGLYYQLIKIDNANIIGAALATFC